MRGRWQAAPERDSGERLLLFCRERGARLGAGPRLCTVVSSRSGGTRVCGCLRAGVSSSNGICSATHSVTGNPYGNSLQSQCYHDVQAGTGLTKWYYQTQT